MGYDDVQLMIEMLINGTPPSAMPANLVSAFKMISPTCEIKDVPSVTHVRKLQDVIRVIADTLAVHRLAKKDKWEQCHTDGSNRRQSAFINFIVNVLEKNGILPVILSAAFTLRGETSEIQVEAIMKILERSGL